MANERWIACNKCGDAVRVDDGSFRTRKGRHCGHLDLRPIKNTESTTVIFRSKDGRISIPWSPDAKCPKGFVREEVKGARAVRRLEKELDAKDYAKFQKYQRHYERVFGAAERERAEGLRQMIREGQTTVPDGNGGHRTIKISEFGKQLARAALERNHNRRTPTFEAGNHRSE